jgi:hypothetical protein
LSVPSPWARGRQSAANWPRHLGWAVAASLLLLGIAQAQEPPPGHSQAQPELDQFGRALVQARCKKPVSVKRERVPSARSPSVLDVVWTTTCPGFEAVAFRPAGGREKPMQLTINAALPGLASELAVGSSMSAVRARLGPPWSTQGDDLVYALDPDRPNDDTLTFRIAGGRVVELIWSWDTD